MNYYRKIMSSLKDDDFTVKFKNLNFRTAGLQIDNKIELNPRLDVLSTCVHEMLHLLYPDWSEKKVLRIEKEICKSMSPRQFKNLMKLLLDKI